MSVENMMARVTDQISLVSELKWFHAIDFGEFSSSGRFEPGKPQNCTLYGVFDFIQSLDIAAASLLDIGTYDGIVAFGSKKLGAREVVGMDAHDNQAFRLSRNLLGYSESDIDYIPNVQISDLDRIFRDRIFDVIVCAGVIYHMLHPMQAFTETRKILSENGYLIMETPFLDGKDGDRAALYFNGIEKIVDEPYTYFVPTRKALIGMANLSGYKVIATRVLLKPRRITLLLKAVTRKELIEDESTPEFIVQMLKRDTCDNEFRFRHLETKSIRKAQVFEKINIEKYRQIDAATESVTFPYHPPIEKPSFGSTRFETPKGNTKKL